MVELACEGLAACAASACGLMQVMPGNKAGKEAARALHEHSCSVHHLYLMTVELAIRRSIMALGWLKELAKVFNHTAVSSGCQPASTHRPKLAGSRWASRVGANSTAGSRTCGERVREDKEVGTVRDVEVPIS